MADCLTPAGIEGEIIYNTDHKLMQFCDGTNWIGMSGTIGTTTDARIGTLTASKWCAANAGGTAIDCTADAPSTAAAGTVAGAVQFRGASAVFAADDANLVWDDTNNRLGIGSTSPSASLHINGALASDVLKLTTSGGGNWSLRNFIFGRSNDGFSLYDLTNSATRLVVEQTGNVGIGTTAPDASALLDVTSTTKGFLPPRMTTAQVTAVATPADGLIVYDTDTDTIKLRANGAWVSLASGTFSESDPQVGTLTASKWCLANAGGTAIDCTTDTPTITETDPKVGTLTNTKWCSTNGTVIDCTADAPAAVAAGTVAGAVQFRAATAVLAADDANLIWDDTNNRLGIGTAFPGQTLQLGTAAVGTENYMAIGDANSQRLKIGYGHATGIVDNNFSAQLIVDGTGNLVLSSRTNNASGIQFYTNAGTDGVERMRIDSAGNVGIGTTTPGGKLNIANSVGGTELMFSGTGAANIYQSDAAAMYINTNGGGMYLGANGSGSQHVSIVSSGNVGIGTTTPTRSLSVFPATVPASGVAKFFVSDSANTAAAVEVGSAGTSALDVGSWDNVNTKWIMRGFRNVSRTTESDTLAASGAPVQVFGIRADGNVGIGTTTPAQKLSVAGTIESTSGGYKFPDGTTQTTAAAGGGIASKTTAQRDAMSPTAGTVIYNSTNNRLEWFNGSLWYASSGAPEIANLKASCKAYFDLGVTTSGTYTIDPASNGTGFSAYCDMTTNGGGWTLCGSYKHQQHGTSLAAGYDYLSTTWNTAGSAFMSGSTVQSYGNFCNLMSLTSLMGQVRSSTTVVQFTTPAIPATGTPFAVGQTNRFTSGSGYIGIRSRSSLAANYYSGATCVDTNNGSTHGTNVCVGNGTNFQRTAGNLNAGAGPGDFMCAYDQDCNSSATQTILLFVR